MGYSAWSDDFYEQREDARAKAGTDAFVHHDAMMSTPVHERGCHPEMDPKGVTRESRDSDEHPESLAIAVVLDVTGSMADTPRVMQQALPKLMGSLVAGGCADPQVLFAAVGDESKGDRAALQVGQFESGIEMDDDLGKMFLEGGGGGGHPPMESYQNALYFFAHHTSTDCHEKRDRKGFLFIVGDEQPYPNVSKAQIAKVFGDKVEADIPVAEIVAAAREKWNVYFVIPQGTYHAKSDALRSYWHKLLGQEFVIELPNASHIVECVTTTVTSGAKPVEEAAEARNVRL